LRQECSSLGGWQDAVAVEAHGFLDHQPEHSRSGQTSHAAGIKPGKLLGRELDRKRVS